MFSFKFWQKAIEILNIHSILGNFNLFTLNTLSNFKIFFFISFVAAMAYVEAKQ